MREIAYIEPDAFDDDESLEDYEPPTHDELRELEDDPTELIVEVLKWKGSATPDYFETQHDIWGAEEYIEELEEEGLVGYDTFGTPEEVEDHLADLHDLDY